MKESICDWSEDFQFSFSRFCKKSCFNCLGIKAILYIASQFQRGTTYRFHYIFKTPKIVENSQLRPVLSLFHDKWNKHNIWRWLLKIYLIAFHYNFEYKGPKRCQRGRPLLGIKDKVKLLERQQNFLLASSAIPNNLKGHKRIRKATSQHLIKSRTLLLRYSYHFKHLQPRNVLMNENTVFIGRCKTMFTLKSPD